MPRKRPDIYVMAHNAQTQPNASEATKDRNPENDDGAEVERDADQAVADAAEESMEQHAPIPRGPRGRYGKRKYLRPAVVRVFCMSKEERALFVPRNGFEEWALALLNAALLPSGQYTCVVSKELRETLGEKIGANWKRSMDETEDAPAIINDIPTQGRKPQ